MELKLQRNLVLQELSILQGVVEHRTTIPILSSILTEADDDSLRMVATDLDMTIMTRCPAEVDGGGRLTLESKVFQNLVRNLPEEEFTLRHDGDSVEIESGRFRSRMSVADAAEYPTIPGCPDRRRVRAAARSVPADARSGRVRDHQGRSRSSSSTERWSS